jgi:hypothetical protein
LHPPASRTRIIRVSKALQPGDEVEWQTSQGKTAGTVKKKLTARTKIKSHVVAAAKDDPQYLVQSKQSGGVAAHKPAALKKRSR